MYFCVAKCNDASIIITETFRQSKKVLKEEKLK